MTLADFVFGHDQVLSRLDQILLQNRLPQSLLISGLAQLGKRTLAEALAIHLFCQDQNGPLEQCLAYQKIKHQNHPDLMIIEQSESSIKIETVRNLQQNLALKPLEAPYKVVIFCDFERATMSAANALLKTLEEPPAHARLILSVQSTSHTLATIVSRCQVIELKPLPQMQLEAILIEKFGLEQSKAGFLSRLAQGRPGWAIESLSNPEQLEERKRYLQELLQVLQQGPAQRLAYASQLLSQSPLLGELLDLWLIWWRDVLLAKAESFDAITNIDFQRDLEGLAQTLSFEQISQALQQTQKTLRNIDFNVNARLNLEVLLLNLPRHLG